MALSFLTPITDRYLFLASIGSCILLADLVAALVRRLRGGPALYWIMCGAVACVWSWKTWDYVGEWRDPRSLWYFAAQKAPSLEACQYSGEVYQDAGDRIQEFIRTGQYPLLTNDLVLAQAVLADPARVEALRLEWTGASPARTNSLAYRDQLLGPGLGTFEHAITHSSEVSAPNLYMHRGKVAGQPGPLRRSHQGISSRPATGAKPHL